MNHGSKIEYVWFIVNPNQLLLFTW